MTRTQFKKKYHDYLKSPQWKKKRRLVLERDGRICQICFVEKAVDVHHMTYVRIFKERLTDLKSVCRKCHEAIHGIGKDNHMEVARANNFYFSKGDLIEIEDIGQGEIAEVRTLSDSADLLVKFFIEGPEKVRWVNSASMKLVKDDAFWDRVHMMAFEALEKLLPVGKAS
jgi:hypothetical protein